MDLYFAGTEQKMWRTLLAAEGVRHVSISYIGLRRRIKDPSTWLIADNFPEGQKVYLDSGAFTLNKDDSSTTFSEAQALAEAYHAFVWNNQDRIEFAAEFDAMVLGQQQIYQYRADFWEHLPAGKWMPIWHGEWGTSALSSMAGEYARVGVLQAETEGDINPFLRRIAGQTKLHGISMTKMEAMSEIPWDSVGSTSWLSPTQHGDTIIWTGRELKRYPKKYKEQARKRHRTWLADQGFNVELIEADDNAELLRLSIWSWKHFAASLQKGRVVTMNVLDPFGQNAEPAPEVVVRQAPPAGNTELVPTRQRKLLPVLGVSTHTVTNAAGEEVEETRLTTPSSGLLRCDNCFMREKCPESEPGAECAFEIPAQVRTAAQLLAVQDWLIETQTQRVAFMRLVEQAEGGYSDANLSSEMDRLNKMIKTKTDAGRERAPLVQMNVGGSGGPGMISRIFGSEVSGKMGALPAPVDTNDVIEAQIVED